MTPLTTPIFYFHRGYKRFFTTPLTIPTQTPSLVKTGLYTKNTVIIIIIIYNFYKYYPLKTIVQLFIMKN